MMTGVKNSLIKWLIYLLVFILFALVILAYIGSPSLVVHESMANTLRDGDVIYIDKLDKSKIKIDDIIVFRHDGKIYIKRCVALPGDIIQIVKDSVYINGTLHPFPTLVKLSNRIVDSATQPIAADGFSLNIFDMYGHTWSRENFGPFLVPFT